MSIAAQISRRKDKRAIYLQLQYNNAITLIGLLSSKLGAVHQGCAVDVLARIEYVNMYGYVLVCIVACIFARIGMYEHGTY